MRPRAFAVVLALLLGLPAGLSAASALIYERLGRPPELEPLGHLGPVPVFSPTLAPRLFPLLLSTQLFSLALQSLAVTLAVPATFAASPLPRLAVRATAAPLPKQPMARPVGQPLPIFAAPIS